MDAREQDLISLLQKNLADVKSGTIEMKVESLPIGDIILCKDTEDLLIIERKTVADLNASIKDGRYKEQSFRLDGTALHNHNIVYLIEGPLKNNRFMNNDSIFYSAWCSLHYYKGFSVWRTYSLAETAEIICNTARYFGKSDKIGYYSNINMQNQTNIQDKDYVNVIKSVKKENITTENISEIMLCQIPNISANSAKAIMKHFKTLPNLIADLQEEGEKCLACIEITNVHGKGRKLNKNCISSIMTFLLQ